MIISIMKNYILSFSRDVFTSTGTKETFCKLSRNSDTDSSVFLVMDVTTALYCQNFTPLKKGNILLWFNI